MNSTPLPQWLSCFPRKLELFHREDPHFQQGWATVTSLGNKGRFSEQTLWHLGSILFKPDSILRRNALRGLHLLKASGVNILAVRAIQFDARTVGTFWVYAASRLSEERLVILERLMQTTKSIYMIVSMPHADFRFPASLHLTELKGQAVPQCRRPGDLRYEMGSPQTAILNFVHTADEPADLVREVGLLFGSSERCRLLTELDADAYHDAENACFEISKTAPYSELDLDDSVSRTIGELASALNPTASRSNVTALIGRLQQIRNGDYGLWPVTRAQLVDAGIKIDELDDIAISAWTAPRHREGKSEAFPSCERQHWMDYPHRPRLLPDRLVSTHEIVTRTAT